MRGLPEVSNQLLISDQRVGNRSNSAVIRQNTVRAIHCSISKKYKCKLIFCQQQCQEGDASWQQSVREVLKNNFKAHLFDWWEIASPKTNVPITTSGISRLAYTSKFFLEEIAISHWLAHLHVLFNPREKECLWVKKVKKTFFFLQKSAVPKFFVIYVTLQYNRGKRKIVGNAPGLLGIV